MEKSVTKIDRRVKRTREILQSSLIELMSEGSYDAITIQDIVDRANVGRTTFYLHYNSKDELFLSCHESMVREFRIGLLHPLSKEDLLSPEIPKGLKLAYRHLEEARAMLHSVFQGKDSLLLLRQLRDWNAQQIESNLRAAFSAADSTIDLSGRRADCIVTLVAGKTSSPYIGRTRSKAALFATRSHPRCIWTIEYKMYKKKNSL
jgi:AcrR family transcriptional regulator